MKKNIVQKTKGLIRGTSSAVLMSIAIHAAVIFGAGAFVVFKIIEKNEVKFVPPAPIVRPKMELRKPKVKVRRASKPRSTKRIVSKNVAAMPDLQLPELSGMGGGLSGGIGGYELMPDVSGMSILGGSVSVEAGNDFEGTYYSLAYNRAGEEKEITQDEYESTLRKFHESGWNPRVFAPFYRAPKKLYTTHFCIPTFPLAFVPAYFGINDLTFKPTSAVAHYKGKMMSKKGGRYRFWATCDGYFTVRLNKKIVIDEGWNYNLGCVTGWKPSSDKTQKYGLVRFLSTVGDWFDLEPGVAYDMEVLMGNVGGLASWVLVIEDESEEYPETNDGGICLPPFRTAPITEGVRESIEYLVNRDVMDLEGGEIFNVH